jgi:prepilin-type N-terminal cleavage/methylation domain-containing protein
MTRHDPYARRPAPRRGFTLVEMLVAMGLTMFIMVILSEAFATGLDVFTQLKAVGDMEENLRAAATALRSDLAADHFEGKRRLSDPDIHINRPREGFVRIFRAAAPTVEGTDPNGLVSKRSTVCVLYLTVKRRGNQRPDFFSAAVPAGSPLLTASTNFFGLPLDTRLQDSPTAYTSQWAEVAYFLVQTGTTAQPSNPAAPIGTPLYALYRVERLLVPDNTLVNWGTPIPIPAAGTPAYYKLMSDYAQMSWRPVTIGANTTMYFNTPSEVVTPANRSFYFNAANNLTVPAGFTLDPTVPPAAGQTLGPGQLNLLSPGGRGASLVIGNVVSFDVEVISATAPPSDGTPRPVSSYNLAFVSGNYDSATAAVAARLRLAVGASLRVWDQRTQQTRQITVMQDM